MGVQARMRDILSMRSKTRSAAIVVMETKESGTRSKVTLALTEVTECTSGRWQFLPFSGQSHFSHGTLDRGPQCSMSNLRNAHVPCRYLCIIYLDFKVV